MEPTGQTDAQREHDALKAQAKAQLFALTSFSLTLGLAIMFSLANFQGSTPVSQFGMIVVTAIFALTVLGFAIAIVRTINKL